VPDQPGPVIAQCDQPFIGPRAAQPS
jgi:hypothetical protein